MKKQFVVIYIIFLVIGILSVQPFVSDLYTDYKFARITGFWKQGEIRVIDSSLRVPNGQPETYCNKVKFIDREKPFNMTFYIINGNNKGTYCGCPSYKDEYSKVKYKLFQDKIIYKCSDQIFLTKEIPPVLKKD